VLITRNRRNRLGVDLYRDLLATAVAQSRGKSSASDRLPDKKARPKGRAKVRKVDARKVAQLALTAGERARKARQATPNRMRSTQAL
jgi:hypothetical protein